MIWTDNLPFGLAELKSEAATRYGAGSGDRLVQRDSIQCCVRGCERWLRKRRRGEAHDFCPDHGISVSESPTYVFAEKSRNIIVAQEDFKALIAKGKKVEHGRLGYESSEDALTWNTFFGAKVLQCLKHVFHSFTGLTFQEEPELFLWGNRVGGGGEVWPDLQRVRRRLEATLSIPTEPDIAMRVPGRALLLIEAKFGSGNGTFAGKAKRFGSVPDFLRRYIAKPGEKDPLNREWITEQSSASILEQLCRNVIFAHWLASPGERVFVANLVRSASVNDEQHFQQHLLGDAVSFRRVTWESIAAIPQLNSPSAQHLRAYLTNKTLHFAPAFDFADESDSGPLETLGA